jgi:glycosyltransferase involved in cell wall biosynthesis
MDQNRFVIVIPSYKNKEWARKNLLSALNQQYPLFRIIYTDDFSQDGTVEEVESIINQYDLSNKISFVKNTERLGAMANMYNMVHSCQDDEIIVVLDGDDWLANSQVLDRLNKEYSKGNVWITYGQYKSYPDNGIGCSRQIPQNVINNNSFRKFNWCSSHVRTYYAWLFKKINKEDFLYNGKFLEMTSDLAAMFPMLEMAGFRQSFIPDILYIYNCTSPINDSKVNLKLQQSLEMIIRNKTPYLSICQ